MAEEHSVTVKKKIECERTVEIRKAIGAPLGLHVINFSIGDKAFARTLEHASVGHGIGVTTVAFVYDSCDHVPVRCPDSFTTLSTEGRDASELSPDVKEGTTRNLGPSDGTIAKEVTFVVTDHAEKYGTGYRKANHCSCDVTPLC